MELSKTKQTQVVIVFLLGWTYFFTVFMKEESLFDAFFHLIDTISEDVVMSGGPGIICAVLFGACILLAQSFLQYLTDRQFFSRMETKMLGEVSADAHNDPCTQVDFASKELEPQSTIGILSSFVWIYFVAMLNVFLLSQPFLMSVSTEKEMIGIVLFALVPMLSLRGMILFGYQNTVSMAQTLVSALLVILLLDIAALIGLIPQIFFVYPKDILVQKSYMYNIILYSFVPVLSEGLAWLILIFSSEDEQK